MSTSNLPRADCSSCSLAALLAVLATVEMPTPTSLASISYTLGRALYISLTNSCNAVSLISTRGPGFAMPPASGFQPLPENFEPTGEQVAEAVRLACAQAETPYTQLCFAGAGEPLMRLRVLEEAAKLIRQDAPDLALRVNTNGLVPDTEAPMVVAKLKGCGVSTATVALASADAEQYTAIMKPEKLRHSPVFSLPLGLDSVKGFVTACIKADINVECTTVEAPGVDVDAARQLAEGLGAKHRSRPYFS